MQLLRGLPWRKDAQGMHYGVVILNPCDFTCRHDGQMPLDGCCSGLMI